MNKMTLLLAVVLCFCGLTGKSQDSTAAKKSPFSMNVDFMSRYIWRGVNLGGNTPSIQPTLKYNFGSTKHAFSLGAWGAYSIGGNQFQECDLTFGYTFNEIISLGVTDYFFPADNGASIRYGNYKDLETGHVFEGTFAFNGTKKIPFTLMFAMNFYGMDARKINADGTDGGIFMSKYVELGYKKVYDDMTVNVFIGGTLDDPKQDRGEIGFYGNESNGIINVGLKLAKEIKITDKFSLPIQTQLIVNPERERIFMVLGISL